MRNKLTAMLLGTAIALPSLTGCMGHMGLTQAAIGVNLKIVDNRFGRAGVYILASPIYAITSVIDLFIINSIEFWSGTNPISKKSPPLAEMPVSSWLKVNEDLPDEMTQLPVKNLELVSEHADAFEAIATLDNDTVVVLKGVRDGERIHIYIDDALIGTTSLEAMQQHMDANAAHFSQIKGATFSAHM